MDEGNESLDATPQIANRSAVFLARDCDGDLIKSRIDLIEADVKRSLKGLLVLARALNDLIHLRRRTRRVVRCAVGRILIHSRTPASKHG